MTKTNVKYWSDGSLENLTLFDARDDIDEVVKNLFCPSPSPLLTMVEKVRS